VKASERRLERNRRASARPGRRQRLLLGADDHEWAAPQLRFDLRYGRGSFRLGPVITDAHLVESGFLDCNRIESFGLQLAGHRLSGGLAPYRADLDPIMGCR